MWIVTEQCSESKKCFFKHPISNEKMNPCETFAMRLLNKQKKQSSQLKKNLEEMAIQDDTCIQCAI